MNKNKWFLNGGRGSGKTFRFLLETYENKIADLEKENAELKVKIGLSVYCEKAQKNGELCLGYGGDEDEPCERCKNCIKCEGGYYQLGETDKDEQLTKAKEIMQKLIANAPDTYSGTNIELQQRKMFSFQDAVNKAEQFLKGESTTSNECHDCAKFDEMPKGPRCKTCDNGSHFQKKEEANGNYKG